MAKPPDPSVKAPAETSRVTTAKPAGKELRRKHKRNALARPPIAVDPRATTVEPMLAEPPPRDAVEPMLAEPMLAEPMLAEPPPRDAIDPMLAEPPHDAVEPMLAEPPHDAVEPMLVESLPRDAIEPIFAEPMPRDAVEPMPAERSPHDAIEPSRSAVESPRSVVASPRSAAESRPTAGSAAPKVIVSAPDVIEAPADRADHVHDVLVQLSQEEHRALAAACEALAAVGQPVTVEGMIRTLVERWMAATRTATAPDAPAAAHPRTLDAVRVQLRWLVEQPLRRWRELRLVLRRWSRALSA